MHIKYYASINYKYTKSVVHTVIQAISSGAERWKKLYLKTETQISQKYYQESVMSITL